jgi:hypothetical protein
VLNSQHVYEIRPRKDRRGVNLISTVLPFGRLWYVEPNTISNAIGYAEHCSRAHDAVIRVYDQSGHVIEAHERAGELNEWSSFLLASHSHFPLKTICYGAVREADADSPRCERSGAFRHGHDKDGNYGGLFALHARRFYTDWGTVRSRHENSSGERASHVSYRAQDVKSHWVQSGMDHFVDRSRRIRLRVAVLRRIESRRRDSRLPMRLET